MNFFRYIINATVISIPIWAVIGVIVFLLTDIPWIATAVMVLTSMYIIIIFILAWQRGILFEKEDQLPGLNDIEP